MAARKAATPAIAGTMNRGQVDEQLRQRLDRSLTPSRRSQHRTDLSVLELNVRNERTLSAAGIATVDELLTLGETDLLACCCRQDVWQCLARFGSRKSGAAR